MSLRSSLVVSIILIVLLTTLFGAGISYWHALAKVEEEMQAAIVVGARVAQNAVDDVEEVGNRSRRLELLVADFHGDRHLRAVWVNGRGIVVGASNVAAPADDVPAWFVNLIRQPELRRRVALPPAFDGLGHFILETDSRNEIGEVWNDIWNTLTILFVFCAAVVASVYWMLGRALLPLDLLAKALAKVGSPGDVPKIPERGPIEFVRVYRGFNAMADRLAETEAQNRRLHDQLLTVQEEERADLARDLHDEIGPFLFSVDVDATSIEKMVEKKSFDKISERVRIIRESVGHMQAHVKDLLGRLRAADLLDAGLFDAVDNLVNFWMERRPNLKFDVAITGEPVTDEIGRTTYRIIQEAISNAVRHGSPDTVNVSVDAGNDGVRVEITDDGVGLGDNSSGSGYGIAGMRERISSLGGSLEVKNRPDRSGVVVKAWLPKNSTQPGGASKTIKVKEAGFV